MIRNYLVVALRTLKRQPVFTAINIGGLSIGIAVCLLIVLNVHHELSYDAFHEKADRLYRVISTDSTGNREAITQGPMGPAMERDFSSVEEAVRLYSRNQTLVSRGERHFYVEDGLHADASFFDVFTFPLVRGNAKTALRQPGSIVLAEATAERFFGDANPMGQTITLDSDEQHTVTGVAKAVPSTSHFSFDYITSMPDSLHGTSLARWNRFAGFATFVLLEEEQSPESVEAGLPSFLTQYLGQERASTSTFGLQPIEDIHLSDVSATVGGEGGNPRSLYVFSTIAALILLIACINYVNLATVRSAQRAKEVGVRRAVGAQRGQVAQQFLGESVLLCGAALVLGVGLARALLPTFGALIGKEIAFVQNGWLLVSFAGAVLGVGLLAGLYPALRLSSYQPTEVLNEQLERRLSGGGLRRGLVVFQFAVAVALIAGATVVFQQLRYVQTKKLGLDEEQVVGIPLEDEDLQKRYRSIREELLALPAVTEVTGMSTALVKDVVSIYTQPEGTEERQPVRLMGVAPNFTETLGIEITAGHDFSEKRVPDAVLINEAAAREFGWAKPLGKSIPFGRRKQRVIGVVNDFHFASLREKIAPLMLIPEAESADYVMARLSAGTHAPSALDKLETAYEQFGSAYPFTYSFLDEDYDALYRSERRTGHVLAVFAGLTVLIAALGLLGLAAFAAEARSKEIAIRKTFGASARQVIGLLSKDFLKLVGIGFALAVPLSWYAMQRWLEGFAYRIELSPAVFIAAGTLALFVALATTGYQALRAAHTNPAQALRDE